MKSPYLTSLAFCLAPLWLVAQDVTTEPIGFNKVTCLTNSDTIVGVPLRAQGSLRGALTAAPVVNGDSATLTLATDSLTAGALTGHFLKFINGGREGRWYDIQTAVTGTANTASTVTISLNGDTPLTATTGDHVLIAQYWTLDTLFPPVASPGVTGPTTSWTLDTGSDTYVPNGHAIVRSDNAITRKTEILMPNYDGTGINLSSTGVFYLLSTGWRKVGAGTTNQGGLVIYPDSYVTIRHNSNVLYSTTLRCTGEVELGNFAIPLTTRINTKQDNFIALMRPVNVKLSTLGLSAPAFRDSPNAINRTDELLVFDNNVALKNKSASSVFYKLSTGWRRVGSGTADQGNIEIPAGAGFLIRKASTTDGTTVFWDNPPSY